MTANPSRSLSHPPAPVASYAVWSGLDHLPIDAAIDVVRRAEAAGYGAFYTREGFGRDPFALHARLAPVVRSMTLGTSIANVYARDAAAMRAAALTLHEILEGRFILGLGVSHAPWVEGIRGHVYAPPVETMRAYLGAYREAPYRGGTPFGEPRVVLAALRPGMVRLAGEQADGAFPYLVPLRAVASLRRDLDAAAAAAGRPKPLLIVAQAVLPTDDPAAARSTATTWLRNYLALPAYVASFTSLGYAEHEMGDPLSERLIDELVLWGDVGTIRERLDAGLRAGANQIAIVPLAPDGTVGDAAAFEIVAPTGRP